MKKLSFPAAFHLILLLSSTVRVGAQSAEQERAFALSVVEAINSKSTERRKALMHPKAIACGDHDSRSMTEEMLSRQTRRAIPGDFKWRVSKLEPGAMPFFADKFGYPVRPTHRLQIDFTAAPHRSTTMLLQLAYEDNRFHEITGCPKPETLQAARIALQERNRRAARVSKLVAGIAPDLKQAIVHLHREGRRVEAIKHYAKVSGEELGVAKDVVEQLAEQSQ